MIVRARVHAFGCYCADESGSIEMHFRYYLHSRLDWVVEVGFRLHPFEKKELRKMC